MTFPLAIRASLPAGGWPAALLRRVAGGERSLPEAIAEYESSMRAYGAEAVRNSLRGAEKIFRADPVAVAA